MDHGKIQKEARELLASFGHALEGVKVPVVSEDSGNEGMRAEEAREMDEAFRELLFANAPKTKGDCLVAEKKSW